MERYDVTHDAQSLTITTCSHTTPTFDIMRNYSHSSLTEKWIYIYYTNNVPRHVKFNMTSTEIGTVPYRTTIAITTTIAVLMSNRSPTAATTAPATAPVL